MAGHYKSYKKKDYGPRRNKYIKVPEVQLIDADGENKGVVNTDEARKIASDQGLDLVEVAPNAKPPVCRVIDFSKYQYEQNKKKRKSRNRTKEMKEFRFSPVIEQHDIDVRVRRAHEYLGKGHNVRISVWRKGRQTSEQAKEMMNALLTYFSDYNTIEAAPRYEGRKIFITFKADGKAKNK
ncbi:translation initiation factor IF-3 [Candidatus Dojkabacteria bacterium]|nr:translation initiation factor IF-3 [Candidatus Dojkabacteria bacterium]